MNTFLVLAAIAAAVTAEDYAAKPANQYAAPPAAPSYGYGDAYAPAPSGYAPQQSYGYEEPKGYGYGQEQGYGYEAPAAPGYGAPKGYEAPSYQAPVGYDSPPVSYAAPPSYEPAAPATGYDVAPQGYEAPKGYGAPKAAGYGDDHQVDYHSKYGYLGFIHPYGKNPYEPDKYADCPQGHYCGKLVGYGGQCKGKYDGFYPDKDCNKYHQCSNGYDYLLACPYGLHWSSKYYRCVYPVHSECGGAAY